MSIGFENLQTLRRIWKHPHSDRNAILSFQVRKLRSVISFAYNNVAYYRHLFDQFGIKPKHIQTIEDLSIIPITSSQDYRVRGIKETLASKVKPQRTVCRATSGSSGRPFIIRRTFSEEHLVNCFRIRARQQFGVRFSDKIAHIRLVSSSHHRETFPGNLRQALSIYRSYSIDCLQTPRDIIHDLATLNPDIIMGYPAVLTHIAPIIADKNIPGINPRFLVTGGESLVPFRRKQIEDGFGKKVYDIYGSHEFNILAWECLDSGQYHICDDNVILEILRDGRPVAVGERGEVVATGLQSYTMPFIRYRLGDIATRGPDTCSCGQPFSTLKAIQGRMHDYFKLPGGRLIHPDEIVVPIMEAESSWFDMYQLLQKREDLIVLKIQPFHKPSEDQLKHVEQLAKGKLSGLGVEFQIELSENMSFEASGKFRFCKSLVNSHCEGIDWDAV